MKLARGPHGYAARGDRCEGIYVKQVGGTPIFVASLTESFEDYDPTSGDLVVEWPMTGSAPVQLRAEGIQRKLYYRMDTVQPSDTSTFRWSSGILAAQRIQRDKIGVVGWTRYAVGDVDRDLFLPLRIWQRRQPPRCGIYELVLFPGVRLEEVYLTLAPVDLEGQTGAFITENAPLGRGYYPAERPIHIKISDPGAPGVYYLRIGARLSTGGSSTLEHWLYHAGRQAASCER